MSAPGTTPTIAGPAAANGDRRQQAAAIVNQLTLDEKASLTAGADMWTTNGIEHVGLPRRRMTDGPNGARGRYWGPGATRALALPTGSAVGATWDRDLVAAVGAELGREARARGSHVLLGPTVNLQRAPLAGRTFECFGEDPVLCGDLGAAYVRGVQSQGVIATVKHLAGNEAEWQRNSVDSIIDERALREVYLRPFQRCVEAGALAVMTAYNRLNGDHCTNSTWLLRDILRDEWGFEGLVMTDWWGLLDTCAAAEAGLDLEMPGPARYYGPAVADAVRRGELGEERLDEIVHRIVSVFLRLEEMGGVEGDVCERSLDTPARRRFARTVSTESMVLIKNEGLLPLDLTSIASVAVIGPNAYIASIMGGGSSQVRAQHRTPIGEALRQLWGDAVACTFEPGMQEAGDATPLESWELHTSDGRPGLEVEYFLDPSMRGEPVAVHYGDDFRLQYLGPPSDELPSSSFAARASTTFTAATPGTHEFVLRSNTPARLFVDGEVVHDLGERSDIDWLGEIHESIWHTDLSLGEQLQIRVEFVNPQFDTYSRLTLACRRPTLPDARARAVRAARVADVAVVVVGHSDGIESEGFDRVTLPLPAGQDDLVRDIATENPATVVVINSGGPVAMPWLDAVPAVVQAWFGGQEVGAALADVLDGSAEPAGRMPFTVPIRIEDTPTYGSFPGEFGEVRYAESLLVGHRWYDTRRISIAVPFGHGGSYTTFRWSEPELSRNTVDQHGQTTVRLVVENTGHRAGSDVIQIYVGPPDTAVFRPRRELMAFEKVHLEPGEQRAVEIEIETQALAYWVPHDSSTAFHQGVRNTPFAATVPDSVTPSGWTVDAGMYTVDVARSIADVHASLELLVATT